MIRLPQHVGREVGSRLADFYDGPGHAMSQPPLRFVILRHSGVAVPHFDLMFETAPGSALATWRSDIWPIIRPAVLTKLDDHRPAYLDYEGPVSGDRGFVKRIACGTCSIERRDDDTFWTIRTSDPLSPTLNIKRGAGNEWLAVPACSA